jgi:hypothetical protein
MKNKLITRSALAGSLMLLGVSSVANAQTTVTGNLTLSYKAIGNERTTDKGFNQRGFGKESQINLRNAGKLNNGLDYVAGFSMEFDGQETGCISALNENTYIDFISGNTTLTFGADHIQNPDNELTNIAGYADVDDIASGIAGVYSKAVASANSPYQAYGVGIVQNTPIGRLSFNYVPTGSNAKAENDQTGNTATDSAASLEDANNSAYEIGFKGNLGVKGLDVLAFYNRKDKPNSGESSGTGAYDVKGQKIGVSYNTGTIVAAAQQGKTTSSAGEDAKTNSFALGYVVSKDVTIAATYAKTDVGGTTVTRLADEKIKMLSLGYSLGPIVVNAQLAKIADIGGESGKDGDAAYLSARVNF